MTLKLGEDTAQGGETAASFDANVAKYKWGSSARPLIVKEGYSSDIARAIGTDGMVQLHDGSWKFKAPVANDC